MLDNISISGITKLDDYPNKCSIKNCKQNITSINLCVPCQKPDMESVNDIKISFCINSFKLLNTILGPKIVFNVTTKIKIIYTAKNLEQSLHSAHWDISFCDFILLEDLCHSECNSCNPSLFIGLEDVCILNCDERSLDLSLIYIICANFNTNYYSNNYDCRPMKDYECKPAKEYECKSTKNHECKPIRECECKNIKDHECKPTKECECKSIKDHEGMKNQEKTKFTTEKGVYDTYYYPVDHYETPSDYDNESYKN